MITLLVTFPFINIFRFPKTTMKIKMTSFKYQLEPICYKKIVYSPKLLLNSLYPKIYACAIIKKKHKPIGTFLNHSV